MFDIGGPEALALVVLGVVLLGPKRLLSVTRQAKGAIEDGKRLLRDAVDGLERDVVTEDLRKQVESTREAVDAAAKKR